VNDTLKRLIRVYRAATLTSGADAASLTERVSGGKPGSSLLQLGDDLPLHLRMEASIARVVDVYEREVEGKRPPHVAPGDKVSAAAKARTKAILAEVGWDPTAVAFMHGSTTENVEKLRGKYRLDPQTGERVRERPLTAPPRVALRRLEQRHADGEYVR
jgi:hypothetical protein